MKCRSRQGEPGWQSPSAAATNSRDPCPLQHSLGSWVATHRGLFESECDSRQPARAQIAGQQELSGVTLPLPQGHIVAKEPHAIDSARGRAFEMGCDDFECVNRTPEAIAEVPIFWPPRARGYGCATPLSEYCESVSQSRG